MGHWTRFIFNGPRKLLSSKLLCFQLEEEIATLRSVLDAKVKEAGVLKQKLGITPLVEFTDDFRHGIQVIRESETLVFVTFFQHLPNKACILFDHWCQVGIRLMQISVLQTGMMVACRQWLWHIRGCVGKDVIIDLVPALIFLPLNYCHYTVAAPLHISTITQL